MRVNVEDSLFVDERFRSLVRLLGDEDKATGMCVRAWRLALRYWSDGEKLVPKKLWHVAGLDPLLDVDLAATDEDDPELVYCRGTVTRLNWINEITPQSKAGHASAEARRAKYGTARPISVLKALAEADEPERTPNDAPNAFSERSEHVRIVPPNVFECSPNAPTPTPTPSLSPTQMQSPLRGEPVSSPAIADRRRGPDPRILSALWNEHRATCQPAVDAKHFRPNSRRWRSAQARLSEHPPEYWRDVIERVARSSFCRGEVESRDGRKSWVANFDFLVRPDSHVKVLEGRYDDDGAMSSKGYDWGKVFGDKP